MTHSLVQVPHMFGEFCIVSIVDLKLQHHQCTDAHHMLPLTKLIWFSYSTNTNTPLHEYTHSTARLYICTYMLTNLLIDGLKIKFDVCAKLFSQCGVLRDSHLTGVKYLSHTVLKRPHKVVGHTHRDTGAGMETHTYTVPRPSMFSVLPSSTQLMGY